MIILVMADLEMLVSDKTKTEDYDYRDEFIERVIILTETYEEWIRRDDAKWLFSDALKEWLWSAYPWDAPIYERTDFYTMFSTWIERADKKIVISRNLESLELRPDIHADYATRDYPELENEWRNVLARNADIESGHTLIFSFGEKPDQVLLLDKGNKESQRFSIIKDHHGERRMSK